MDFEHPPHDPIAQAHKWFEEAATTGLPNPNAMTLATVSADGRPSARIVLLKGFDAHGAVFFTNSTSRKGTEVAATGVAALLFHWDPLDRQIRIEGTVTRLTDAENDAYFATRARGSQIGAWASAQSQPLDSRNTLEEAVETMEAKFEGQDVPRPPYWGGYRVALEALEFWQGHPYRLHDRVVYRPNGEGGWTVQRLYP
ncbi:MAG: pyridoxamine 5'-phosphate oxidase [Phycisphaerales bacterium]|nr:pyridoxamine 5'-phosphate oxidase [Phycisphaerales bacterium]